MSFRKPESPGTLDAWIDRATRGLAPSATLRARSELEDFAREAVDAALARGVTRDAAERDALAALGSAVDVNREYRRVLLTEREDIYLRTLRGEKVEAIAQRSAECMLCAKIMAIVIVAELALIWLDLFFLPGSWLFIGVPTMGVLAAQPIARRGRLRRDGWKYLLIVCGAALFAGGAAWWAEMQFWSMPISFALGTVLSMLVLRRFHARLRRKIPPSEWPRQLT